MNKVALPVQTIRRSISPGIPTWVLAGLPLFGVLLLITHIRLSAYAYDDAFIHFRVVRNLFDFGAPYYNPGEMVKVSTSSGWVLFLAVFYGITRLLQVEKALPLLVSILNALITLGAALVFTGILRKLLQEQISLRMQALFFLSCTALLLSASIGLMETPLALLIAGAGIYLLTQDKLYGFILLGLMVFLRLELVVLLGLAGLFFFLQRPARLLRIMGYSALGMVTFFMFDLYFFKSLTPQSMLAKSIVYSRTIFQVGLESLTYLFPASPIMNIQFFVLFLSIVVITLITTAITSFFLWKHHHHPWPMIFCFWGILTWAGYSLSHAFVFEWYIPLYVLPIIVSCFLCVSYLNLPRTLLIKGFIFVFLFFSLYSIGNTIYASIFDFGAFSHFTMGSRVKTYIYLGEVLYEEYPEAKLLTSEIGGLGYSFNGQILDGVGLASPEALEFHPMPVPDQRSNGIIGAIPPNYVKKSNPEIIVSFDFLAQALLQSEVSQQYNMILIPAYLPEDEVFSRTKTIWGSQNLRVYIRKDLPVSPKLQQIGSHSQIPLYRAPVLENHF